MHLYANEERPSGVSIMDWFSSFATKLAESRRLAIFQEAIDQLVADFGDWNIPWGQVNRFQRLSGAIDASFDDDQPSIPVGFTTARWGHLAAYGMRGTHDVKKIYGTRGNSFVAAVAFGDTLEAQTILAGGQSSDPSSPHFNDQAEMYANGEFKKVAFYRQDVEERKEEKYSPGGRKVLIEE